LVSRRFEIHTNQPASAVGDERIAQFNEGRMERKQYNQSVRK
jgi:hypothetical protein